MADFIDEMPLQEGDKRKLRCLGAGEAGELLALLNAADEASSNFLGTSTLNRVRGLLRTLLHDREREVLARPVPTFHTGANLGRPPMKVLPPQYNIAERDRLFSRMQALKGRVGAGGQGTISAEIEELESKLNNMLER